MKGRRRAYRPFFPAFLILLVFLISFPALAAPEESGGTSGQETVSVTETEAFPLPGSPEEAELDKEIEELLNSDEEPEITETLPELPSQDLKIEENPDTELAYDRVSRMYVYRAGDSIEYAMNVPDGAVASGAVRFDARDGNVVQYTKDGVQIFPEENTFTEPGRYEITWLGTNADESVLDGNAEAGEGALKAVRMRIRFRIIPGLTNTLESVDVPEGFRLASVTVGGNPLLAAGRLMVDRDGDYSLLYTGLRDPGIEYELRFRSDRTKPEIRFSKDVTGEREASAPVSFTVLEQGAAVSVKRDGADMVHAGNRLTSGGSYTIIATDPAGNETAVSFYLRYSIRNQLIFLVILFAGIFIAGGILLLRMRRSPRVL